MSVYIRTGEGNKKGDIFTLIMEIQDCTFGQANKYLHQLFNLTYEYKSKKTIIENNTEDPLAIFKKIKKRKVIVNQDLEIYDSNILKEYVSLPYISWIREGIMPFTCKRFNIGYCFDKKRIVIPERYWCGGDNDYIGIMGRTTVENYDMFDIAKYFPLQKYFKGSNVYGLNENYKSIQEAGYCVIFESQKSVLKRHSRKDETGGAIGNCEFTEEQVKILLSLNVDIVVCLDEGIDINHIRKECDKFYGLRNVYYIYDKWNLIKKGSKDSPADLPNKQYEFMFKYKIKYDEKERKCFQDWQENKRRIK